MSSQQPAILARSLRGRDFKRHFEILGKDNGVCDSYLRWL
jgi:hypothetical protein